MTIYQEAHNKIDQFPEETVYLFIQLMDKMSRVRHDYTSKTDSKLKFLETAGTIPIDSDAVAKFREVSMI